MESDVHVLAIAVDGVGEWLYGVGVENDFVDGGSFAEKEGVEVFAWLAVRGTVGCEDKKVVVKYRVGLVSGSVDGIAEVDRACPSVSVPE